MIYNESQAYTPNLKIHKQGFLVLDLAVLKKPCFVGQYERIGVEAQLQAKIVENKYADTLVSPDDLNLKLKAVILTTQCFFRNFNPVQHLNEYPSQCTLFQYLKKRYESYLTIGVKINLQRPQQIQQLKQSNHLKKIKFFSFDINESSMEVELPLMRKHVKQLFSISKKTHFHINLTINSIQGLKKLKEQLIMQEYPIEYCALQTNLLNLIEKRYNLTLCNNWEEIAFKYILAISKYIPTAIGCVMEAYQASKDQQIDIQSLMICLNHINTRNQQEEKEYKKFHHTGMAVPQPIIRMILKEFSIDSYGHYRAKGDWSLYLSNLSDVLQGRYKPQEKYQFQEVGNMASND